MTAIWLRAWLLCGALDAAYASVTALLRGKAVAPVWTGVASAPFGDAALGWGAGGVAAGLAVHFAIMAAMTAVFLFGVWRIGWVRQHALLAGTLYGLLLYGAMYCIVLAARYPANFPQTDPVKIAIALFPHIFFVGLPLAVMARRATR